MAGTDLSPRELDVLWLYGFDGLPVKGVAHVLGISEETCKSYLKRLREKFWARGIANTHRTALYRIALVECIGKPECRDARDELLRELLTEDAPELFTPVHDEAPEPEEAPEPVAA